MKNEITKSSIREIAMVIGCVIIFAFVALAGMNAVTKILVPVEFQISVVGIDDMNLGAFGDVTLDDTENVSRFENNVEIENDLAVNNNLIVGDAGGNVIIAKEGEFTTTVATSTNGLLRWQPGATTTILGITADTRQQTATTSFVLKCGILDNSKASSSIAYDNAYASTSANLISNTVATGSMDFFTINNGNAGYEGFATTVSATDYVVCHASTSYESSWRGLCLGTDDGCLNATVTPSLGSYKIFYIAD